MTNIGANITSGYMNAILSAFSGASESSAMDSKYIAHRTYTTATVFIISSLLNNCLRFDSVTEFDRYATGCLFQ